MPAHVPSDKFLYILGPSSVRLRTIPLFSNGAEIIKRVSWARLRASHFRLHMFAAKCRMQYGTCMRRHVTAYTQWVAWRVCIHKDMDFKPLDVALQLDG